MKNIETDYLALSIMNAKNCEKKTVDIYWRPFSANMFSELGDLQIYFNGILSFSFSFVSYYPTVIFLKVLFKYLGKMETLG